MANESTLQPKKLDNHEMIDSAIEDIDSVIRNAENLLAKITGDVSDSEDKGCDKVVPVLVEVLQRAPENIRRRNEKLHDLLNNITDALF